MYTGEIKFWLAVASAFTCSLALFSILLFAALWEYRVLVAICLLIVLLTGAFSLCVVVVRGNTPPVTLKGEGDA